MSRMILRRAALVVRAAALVAAAVACSPELNWRELRPAGSALQALLPCKPDEATRTVPLDGRPVAMHLAGCDAGGATFVIGWADMPGPQLGAALGAWQDATLARARIASGPDAPAGRAFRPPGALALPQSVRLQGLGRSPDGTALALDAAWFAYAGAAPASTSQVLFAAVYRQPRQAAATETFFSSLRLP